MKKRELQARIEELEREVADLKHRLAVYENRWWDVTKPIPGWPGNVPLYDTQPIIFQEAPAWIWLTPEYDHFPDTGKTWCSQ